MGAAKLHFVFGYFRLVIQTAATMNNHLRKILFYCCGVLHALIAVAATLNASEKKKIQFERMGTAEGLPSLSVSAITQDALGFMWLATTNGLCRVEGRRCRVFAKDSLAGGLPDSWIPIVCLWRDTLTISVAGGKSYAFDYRTEKFIPSQVNVKQLDICAFERLRTWRHDKTSLINPDGHRFTFPKQNIFVWSYLERSNGEVWIGSDDGLWVFYPDSKKFKVFKTIDENPSSLPANSVRCVYEDRNNNIWIATYGGGVAVVRSQPHFFETVRTIPRILIHSVQDLCLVSAKTINPGYGLRRTLPA